MAIPAFLFFFVFFFYLRTHCATFNINDSGETIMVCDLLTISHSPGYPLHTLWGRVNCLLPLGKPMLRVTFCSMITGAASVVMLYWAVKMMFKGIFNPSEPSGAPDEKRPGAWIWEVPALFAALTFAFSYQHWFQCCGAKGGIYTLNTFFTTAMICCLFKMRERGWFTKSFLLMLFIFGLGVANHWHDQGAMFPGYFLLLISNQKKIPMMDFFGWVYRPINLLVGAVSFLFFWGLFTFAFSNEASHAFLLAGEMEFILVVSAVVVRIFGWLFLLLVAVVTMVVSVILPVFISFILSVPFQPSFVVSLVIMTGFVLSAILIRVFGPSTFARSCAFGLLSLSAYLYLPLRTIPKPLINWWNPNNLDRFWGTVVRKGYQGIGETNFWVSFTRNAKRYWFHAQDQFGFVFSFLLMALAIWGIVWLFKRQRSSAIGYLLMAAGIALGVWSYCKPLEGYQWTLDNFFAPVFLVTSVFAAAGLAGFFEWASKEWEGQSVRRVLIAAGLGLALIPLVLNYGLNDQSRYICSYDEGVNMLKTVSDDGVILCNGDIDILPLWYLQWVEGKRPKVATFTMQLIPYDWYRDPLFERCPYLAVPIGTDAYGHPEIHPEIVVQDIINQHSKDRSFYFTNIFTAQWMREKNAAIPDGFLWRMVNTKDLNFAFTSGRLNWLWDTYRLRNLNEADRGYWDEYTDVMKDSYGIGYDFTGYFAYMNHMSDISLWCFNNALKYRQPQTLSRIYMMLGETYLTLGDPATAIVNYQETLKREPRNPYIFAKMGDSYFMSKDYQDAESYYRASLSINAQQPEASNGLQVLTDPIKAIKQFQEALSKETSKSPQSAYLYGKIGDAHFVMKNFTAAKKAYRQSLSINPSQPEAVNGLRLLGDGHS